MNITDIRSETGFVDLADFNQPVGSVIQKAKAAICCV